MKLKHFAVASLAFLLSLSLVAAPAAAEVSLGVDAASTFQSIETQGALGNSNDETMAFGDPRGNLHVYGDVASGVEAYMEVLLNPTNESNSVDHEGEVKLWQGYVTLTEVIPGADVKMGNFEVDYGAHRADLSINGRAMDNNFVTNQLVAPVTTESGVELSGSMDRFAWSAAVTNGMKSDGSGNVVAEDSSLAYNFRVWGNITPSLTTSLSYYASDQSDDPSTPGSPDGSSLFGSQAPVTTILSNGATPGVAVASPNIAPSSSATDLMAYQLDLGYQAMGNDLSAYYGAVEDGEVNTQEWTYYSLEYARDLTPQTYFGARYGAAENDADGLPTAQEYNKISVGLGHSLNENTLAKLEYLQQEWDNTQAEFDGVVGQLAFSF